MGNSTRLYSLDLNKVTRAIKNHTPEMIAHFREMFGNRLSKESRKRIARIIRDGNDNLVVNGVPMTKAELKRVSAGKAWRGSEVRIFFQMTKKERANSKVAGENMRNVYALLHKHIGEIGLCFEESDLWRDDGDDPLPEEIAAVSILENKLPEGDCSSIAYGFERICEYMSNNTITIRGKCLLSHLGIETKMMRQRSPIKLPHDYDFPVIGYLSTVEVRRELRKLSQEDLVVPYDRYLTKDRLDFLKFLEEASKQQLAVVGFYA